MSNPTEERDDDDEQPTESDILVVEAGVDETGVLEIDGIATLLMAVRCAGMAQIVVTLQTGWADDESRLLILDTLQILFEVATLRGEKFVVEVKKGTAVVFICNIFYQKGSMAN